MEDELRRSHPGEGMRITAVLAGSTCAIAARRGDVNTVLAAVSIGWLTESRSTPQRSDDPARTMLDLVRQAAEEEGDRRRP